MTLELSLFSLGFLLGAFCLWWVLRAKKPARPPAADASQGTVTLRLAESPTELPKEHTYAASALPEVLVDSCVDDVMVPRLAISAIDLDDEALRHRVINARYRMMPVFNDTLDKIVGILDLRDALRLTVVNEESLAAVIRPAYYVPSGTPLLKQFEHFRASGQRMGLVVDEYGELEGLVTLEDLSNEIIACLLAESRLPGDGNAVLPDEGIILDASLSLRALNRRLGSHFPLDGPKTLSGLITETLGDIPEAGQTVALNGYRFEILQTKKHTVRMVRLRQTHEQLTINN